jgi:hypothetical protein
MAVRTKVDAVLASQAQEHSDDPERAGVLECARRFKSSWIELAEALTRVRAAGRFRDWGYPSVEEYAKRELFLKQDTVDKLTGSYVFLKKRAPEVLARDGVSARIPSYQAVDFLARAEERSDLPRDVVEQMRNQVLEQGAGVSAISRQYKDIVFPRSAEDKRKQDAAGLRNVGRRLHELLQETRAVPKRLAGEVAQALERLLEALASDDEKAA